MIIDIHTHVPTKRDEWSGFLDICEANQVSLAIASALGVDEWPQYPSAKIIRAANALALEFSEFAQGKVFWMAYLNPQNDNWQQELETCIKEGAKGIKLWISLKSQNEGIKNCFPLLEAAGRAKLPVLIHTLNRTGPLYPGEIGTAELAFLAGKFPQTTMIQAHTGSDGSQTLEILSKVKNVYADISGYFPKKGIVKKIIEKLGANRVLFGSDICGNLYAREQSSQLAKVILEDIAEDEKELILFRNAQNIFSIDIKSKNLKVRQNHYSGRNLALPNEDHFCFTGKCSIFDSNYTIEHVSNELYTNKVSKAFVVNANSIYTCDLAAENRRFWELSKGIQNIQPLATLNPAAKHWKWLLEEACKSFSGGFISPYLHAWQLDAALYSDFFEACAEREFPLWINCNLADNRFYPAGIAFRTITNDELVNFVKHAVNNSYILQSLDVFALEALIDSGYLNDNFKFDISRLTDFTGHLNRIIKKYGTANLLYGSEYPLRSMQTVKWCANKIMNYDHALLEIDSNKI